MAGFKMDDYVDVAERIADFSEKYPDGSLQSELVRNDDGWLCTAYAYRTPDDPRPGVGHAFEPVPGKTPYTKDSEAMNAETSAWGRAIVALGFRTKKIASAQEVRARQGQPKADPREFATLSAQLLTAAEKLGAKEATEAAISRHPNDVAWVRRALETAQKNLEAKAA